MMESLVSIIMSTYNESREELQQSLESILNQSYTNLQIIVINDNPYNDTTRDYLYSVFDPRLEVYSNEKNIGLVASLNRAMTYAKGEFIARMDADDVSELDRIEKQMKFLCSRNLDMIGCDIRLINTEGFVIQDRMHFPESHAQVEKYIPWGSCLAHPTWFVKSGVYKALKGYRNVPSCEDYDFLLRVLATSQYKVGNAPFIGLNYRIRENGVSCSNANNQYILRLFISKHKKDILTLSEKEILNYKSSSKFEAELAKYNSFLEIKNNLKKKKSIHNIVGILLNKYFYLYCCEKFYLYSRERKYEK